MADKKWAGIENRLYDRRRGDFVSTENFHAGKLKQLIENPDTRDAFYLRGSLVYLYQCTVDVSNLKPPYTNHPNREYGFNELFKSGSHPPGTPLLITYRRSDIRNLTAPEFASKTLWL